MRPYNRVDGWVDYILVGLLIGMHAHAMRQRFDRLDATIAAVGSR